MAIFYMVKKICCISHTFLKQKEFIHFFKNYLKLQMHTIHVLRIY